MVREHARFVAGDQARDHVAPEVVRGRRIAGILAQLAVQEIRAENVDAHAC